MIYEHLLLDKASRFKTETETETETVEVGLHSQMKYSMEMILVYSTVLLKLQLHLEWS
jgi:hypothetical protein